MNMNRYQRMMETVMVPEGQAERLREAVLAAGPGRRRGRPFRPWGRGRKALLAAALAAALLIPAVAAAESADWDPVFLGIFGQASRDVPGAEGLFQDVQAVGDCGDVTLTVRQAIGDRGNLYLLLDYRLPESADLEAAAAAEHLRPPRILVYKGKEASWEEVQAYATLEEAERELGTDSVSGQVTSTLGLDPETGVLSVLVECDLAERSPLAKLLNAPVTLVAGPPAIAAEEGEEDIPLADQLAVVSFTPDFDVDSVKGSAKAEDGTVCKAEVSPLSLSVRIKGKDLPDWDAKDLLAEYKALVALRFRDGREIPAGDLEEPGGSSSGGASLTHHDDGRRSGTLTLNLVFETFLDPSQVEAVLVGDVEIPVS